MPHHALRKDTHIAILGAGITGITMASKLLDRGFQVTVIDRQRYPAMETSYANGGQLSASNAEVWNSIGTVIKGLKWMLKKDAPLSMNLAPSWHKYSWIAEFLAAIPRHDANTVETARLAQMARGHLMDMASKAGVAFDIETRGILHFYEDAREFEAGRRSTDLLRKAGLDRKELTADGVRAIEPTITADVVGGFFTESDFTGDIHKFTKGLARYLEAQGVKFLMNTSVTRASATLTGVDITASQNGTAQQMSFDGVVVSAGVGSRDLAAQLGDRVNVYPVKGYSITVNMPDESAQDAAPWVSLLDEKAKIVTSRLGKDRLRIAGTAEFSGANYDIRADRIKPLLSWCQHHFPDVPTDNSVPWAGLRPMMPNMMPRLGRGKNPRVFYNTGHGHLGWTLSAATAQIVAADVAEAFEPRPTFSGIGRPSAA
ncbi:D-amino acid dehydrogenase [Litoreibacter roseus]|uniref:D-amino acid dehydrogenase n=1 Tax=Litoreibacter roseus TaxID=2601869 RepID=A0A6N6JGF6_9RHOB|nr:D-amino acid dehydrogenase [Litoreibacter roseus]GFE64302.1 D-amino acid dehydrogenase [Litoreibacter roseus]